MSFKLQSNSQSMENSNVFISFIFVCVCLFLFVFVVLLIPTTLDWRYETYDQQANEMDQNCQCDCQYDCHVALTPVLQNQNKSSNGKVSMKKGFWSERYDVGIDRSGWINKMSERKIEMCLPRLEPEISYLGVIRLIHWAISAVAFSCSQRLPDNYYLRFWQSLRSFLTYFQTYVICCDMLWYIVIWCNTIWYHLISNDTFWILNIEYFINFIDAEFFMQS
jgi:hypothetical protein